MAGSEDMMDLTKLCRILSEDKFFDGDIRKKIL